MISHLHYIALHFMRTKEDTTFDLRPKDHILEQNACQNVDGLESYTAVFFARDEHNDAPNSWR